MVGRCPVSKPDLRLASCKPRKGFYLGSEVNRGQLDQWFGAGTGSGKTLAFYLPALTHLVGLIEKRSHRVDSRLGSVSAKRTTEGSIYRNLQNDSFGESTAQTSGSASDHHRGIFRQHTIQYQTTGTRSSEVGQDGFRVRLPLHSMSRGTMRRANALVGRGYRGQ